MLWSMAYVSARPIDSFLCGSVSRGLKSSRVPARRTPKKLQRPRRPPSLSCNAPIAEPPGKHKTLRTATVAT